jgi:hypothetical protein
VYIGAREEEEEFKFKSKRTVRVVEHLLCPPYEDKTRHRRLHGIEIQHERSVLASSKVVFKCRVHQSE